MLNEMTPEEELRLLITESRIVLAKIKKSVNIGIPLLVGAILTFLGSTYYNNNRVTKLESTAVTTEKLTTILNDYPRKTEIIFLQNDVQELNDATYAKNSWVVPLDIEAEYARILKRFNGDVSRGVN